MTKKKLNKCWAESESAPEAEKGTLGELTASTAGCVSLFRDPDSAERISSRPRGSAEHWLQSGRRRTAHVKCFQT